MITEYSDLANVNKDKVLLAFQAYDNCIEDLCHETQPHIKDLVAFIKRRLEEQVFRIQGLEECHYYTNCDLITAIQLLEACEDWIKENCAVPPNHLLERLKAFLGEREEGDLG